MSARTHARPSVIRAVPAVLLLALLAACGGSDESSDGTAETTTTTESTGGSQVVDAIAESVLDDGAAADETEARCVAERLVDELGEEEATRLDERSDDLMALPEDQQELVRTTFNDCVSGEAIASALLEGVYASLGPDGPSDEVVACVAERYDGSVGDTMAEFTALEDGEMPDSALDALDECVPASDITELLTAEFEGSGLTPEQASCMGERVAERVSIGQFARIGASGGEISPEIEAILEEEAAACGGTPGGA